MSFSDEWIERIAQEIAGDIILSDEPGKVMRKWRERFQVSQKDLAEYLGVSPSVISDYESGRRTSPRIRTIKRMVEALIMIDLNRGGNFINALRKLISPNIPSDILLDIREFQYPVRAVDFCRQLNCEVIANEDILKETMICGYTVVDSIKAILKLTPEQLLRLYGVSPQRAAIFTKVSTGRSPMVAIRIVQIGGGKALKPAVVILHGPKKVDELAIKIAELEKIPLLVSKIETIDELLRRIRSFTPYMQR